MTKHQRKQVEWIAQESGWSPDIRESVAAALADLDACRAALQPVVRQARQYGPGWACKLTVAETDAVLAAAGEEERP